MNKRNDKIKLGTLAFAVQGALLAMSVTAAYAEDDEATLNLKLPTNSVSVGVANVSDSSPKFGEYNGLEKKGATEVTNFNVRGGDAYGSATGTHRIEVIGKDIGLSSNSISASASNQGSWEVGIIYDELQHNTATGYQTPYIGTMGGNNFVLPGNFGGVRAYNAAADGTSVTGKATNLMQGTLGLTAAQKAAFNSVDVYNTRKNSTLNAKVFLNPQVKLTFDYNHLKQGGAKLQGFGTDGSLANTFGTGTIIAAGNTGGNEKVAILPMPTNYTVDTFNLGANWAGDDGHFSAAYNVSFFKDNFKTVSFQSFWIPLPVSYTSTAATPWLGATGAAYAYGTSTDTLTTPPDNQNHQINLMGGYDFTKATKLSGGLTYGRNTQNDPFIASELTYLGRPSRVLDPISQIASAKALIVTTHADVKLTNQTTDALKLAAAVKYDKHLNRTPSNIYDFSSIGFGGAAATHETLYPNTPLSNSKSQFELAGDYTLTAAQHVRVAYNREDVRRWCEDYAVSGGVYAAVTTATSTYGTSLANGVTGASAQAYDKYPAGTNCVVAVRQKENKLGADYRIQASDDISVRAGYSYADRKTKSDPNARAAFSGGNITSGAFGNGTGSAIGNFPINTPTILGLNGGDVRGFYPVFDASRKQHLVKGSVTWQVSDALSVGIGGRYSKDKYGDSTFGVQNGDYSSLNLDASYAYSDTGSFTPYVTQQRRSRDMSNFGGNTAAGATAAAATATANAVVGLPAGIWSWSNSLTDKDVTLGLAIKQGGLLASKLVLSGDVGYSLARTSYATGYNVGGQNCDAPSQMTCGGFPDITTKLLTLKLVGDYKIDNHNLVSVGYRFQKLEAIDFYYNGYQTGYTPNSVMPDNQKSGSYKANVIAATYTYSFR
jgi:MtrB/PioB family decaheme-associated outer membrane protein